jgi:two-component system response regulator HydG
VAGEDFRQYFDEIVNAVHDGVMIVSPDGVIRMANAAMARMTGFKIEELVGSTCNILECDVVRVSVEKRQVTERFRWKCCRCVGVLYRHY